MHHFASFVFLVCLFVALVSSLDFLRVSIDFQFIGATMGSAELQIQTENGLIGMPSNICCVVVEYLAGGALKSYLIKNRRRKLAFKVVVQLALDLARGYHLLTQFLLFTSLLLLEASMYFLIVGS